jgi:hypothetical protein
MISNPVKFCEQLLQSELGFLPDYKVGPSILLKHLLNTTQEVPYIRKQHLKNLLSGRALLTKDDAYSLAKTFIQTNVDTWLRLEQHYRSF